MATGASQRLSIDTKCLSPPDAGNGGARIGRPPQWTDSRSRKLARLYVYTTLPVEKIIKAIFPDDNDKVKYEPTGAPSIWPSIRSELIMVVGRTRRRRPCTRCSVKTPGLCALQTGTI